MAWDLGEATENQRNAYDKGHYAARENLTYSLLGLYRGEEVWYMRGYNVRLVEDGKDQIQWTDAMVDLLEGPKWGHYVKKESHEVKPDIDVKEDGTMVANTENGLKLISGISSEELRDINDRDKGTEAPSTGWVSTNKDEVRTTSSTGGQKGVKPERYDLIPVEALDIMAKLYGFGAIKYAAHNWRKGYEWSKSYASLMRHATRFWAGEDIDEETGLPHLAGVGFHAFTLMVFMVEHPEFDDRFTTENKKTIEEALEETGKLLLNKDDVVLQDGEFYEVVVDQPDGLVSKGFYKTREEATLFKDILETDSSFNSQTEVVYIKTQVFYDPSTVTV